MRTLTSRTLIGTRAVREARVCGPESGSIRRAIKLATATTAAAPRPYPTRQFVAAVTSPMIETPISNPSAHEISISPMTRLRCV